MKYSIQKLWLSLVCMIVGTAAWGQDTDWKKSIVLCTSEADLVAGGIYYIGTSATKEGPFMANSTGGTNFPIYPNSYNTLCILTLGGNANDGWTFSYKDGNTIYFLDPTGVTGSNYLKRSESVTKYGKFSISFDTSNNTAIITSKGKTDRNIIRYNKDSYCFSCYSSGNDPIYLYKATASITLNAACHDENGKVFSTYSSSVPFVVPENLTISEIGINDGKLNVQPYNPGAIVPANTGVMVSASDGGDYTVDLTTETGTSVLGDANRLRPSGPSGITADDMDPNCLYYRLTMHKGTQIGFWWGAENGAAFPLAANKAYLAVPQTATSAKMGMWFGSEGDPTAIDAIGSKPAEAVIYNLQGQRISHLQKGVNIVEGKKIIR